jgi:hypothetical protein
MLSEISLSIWGVCFGGFGCKGLETIHKKVFWVPVEQACPKKCIERGLNHNMSLPLFGGSVAEGAHE